ncbi:MAG: peroxiredoxin family protein [Gemmatimonadales bacterium]
MNAYRDQYAKLFGTGDKVKVLAVSVDADTMLASWARDSAYPVTFLSDTGAVVGRKYGAYRQLPNGRVIDNRTLFIVDRSGKIAHVMAPFRETDPTAYDSLAAAVQRISGGN